MARFYAKTDSGLEKHHFKVNFKLAGKCFQKNIQIIKSLYWYETQTLVTWQPGKVNSDFTPAQTLLHLLQHPFDFIEKQVSVETVHYPLSNVLKHDETKSKDVERFQKGFYLCFNILLTFQSLVLKISKAFAGSFNIIKIKGAF